MFWHTVYLSIRTDECLARASFIFGNEKCSSSHMPVSAENEHSGSKKRGPSDRAKTQNEDFFKSDLMFWIIDSFIRKIAVQELGFQTRNVGFTGLTYLTVPRHSVSNSVLSMAAWRQSQLRNVQVDKVSDLYSGYPWFEWHSEWMFRDMSVPQGKSRNGTLN